MNKGRYFANVNAETVYYFNERIKKMFFFDVYSNFWKEYKKYLIWNFKTSLVIIETSKKSFGTCCHLWMRGMVI